MGVSMVQDLLIKDDSIIVVGNFGLAIYKDTGWIHNYHNINTGFQEIIPYNSGYLLATGNSYFGPMGRNPNLLFWDGDATFTEFENVTDITLGNGGIFALAEYKNELYAAGSNMDSLTSPYNIVLRWTGSEWKDLDGGIYGISKLGGMNDMAVYQGDLYIGGMFYQDKNSEEHHIARWDGTNWKTVGGGFGWGVAPGSETVDVLHVHDGYLYAAGLFHTPGGIPANSIARWDGKEWCGCGSTFDGQILTMTHYRDTLYIGGGFNTIDGESIRKVARFVGDDFADTCGAITTDIQNLLPEKNIISGYPNPCTSEINVYLPSLQNKHVEVAIRNSLGQVVYVERSLFSNTTFTVNTNELTHGIYFGEIVNDTESYVFKFIKK